MKSSQCLGSWLQLPTCHTPIVRNRLCLMSLPGSLCSLQLKFCIITINTFHNFFNRPVGSNLQENQKMDESNLRISCSRGELQSHNHNKKSLELWLSSRQYQLLHCQWRVPAIPPPQKKRSEGEKRSPHQNWQLPDCSGFPAEVKWRHQGKCQHSFF